MPDPRGPAFPSTRWSRILAAPGQRDLEALARDYWRPIQAWLRARLRVGDDEAADLAQEAFLWLFERRLLDRADPARGRFRALLKTALANFAIERHRHASAQKRGGDVAHEALDAAVEHADPQARTPDQELDDAWRRELLQRACAQLERELTAEGRGVHFALFADFYLGDADVDQATLAERHGVSRIDVQNRLAYARRRYREVLRSLVLETVRGEDDLQEELHWLFGPEGGGVGGGGGALR